jgi:hypothetical protein
MYPTVCTLMHLWGFVTAQGMTWQDASAETRALLDDIDLDRFRSKATWTHLPVLVRVQPQGEVFPVRAPYAEGHPTIGANHLSSDPPIWFTLADCIATKLLTGHPPQIVEAIRFVPGPSQEGLRTVNISGKADYAVDPAKEDFFKRVIELRQATKRRMAQAQGDELDALDTEQNALKIAANATSYGSYVEVNVATRREAENVTVYSGGNEPFTVRTDKVEEPGPYFHPLLATLITGAARLMLAIAERLVMDHGLEWSFCDTDSMAIAKPESMANDNSSSGYGRSWTGFPRSIPMISAARS